MKRILSKVDWAGLLLAVFAFGVYATTLSPFMVWEDSGELATAAYTLGIPHPTGYPVFAMLGRVFSLLPLGDLRVITKLNLMVALFCATSAYFFYRLFLRLLTDRSIFPVRSSGTSAPKGPAGSRAIEHPFIERAAAALGVLSLAFSWTFWSEATSLEVYALHMLMLSLVTLTFLRSLSRPESGRLWLLFAYVLGLSFSHHMMTVLLAPAFLTLYFWVRGAGSESWTRIARAVPVFVLGLTPYLYLPLRASADPQMNWGDPSTWGRFLFHVSGGQYRFKMFSSTDVAWHKLGEFSESFTREFGFLPLALALLGLWATYTYRRRLFVFTGLLFATGVVYAVNYDFEDPNFYLPAWVTVAMWAALGAGFALSWARSRGRATVWLVAIACSAAALQPLVSNYRDADESDNHAVEDYARNVLASVAPNGVLFTDQSETVISPSYYLQSVEGMRPDVVVWDYSQWVAGYAWYFDGVERRHPGALRGARAEIDAYTSLVSELLDRMPLGPADSIAYGRASASAMDALFRSCFVTRPVYATIDAATRMLPGLQQRVSTGLNIHPEGMAFRFYSGSLPAPVPSAINFRPLVPGKGTVARVSEFYAAGFTNMGAYQLVAAGDTLGARTLLQRALIVRPGYPQAIQWLQRL